MAIEDIIRKIETDAQEKVSEVCDEAERQAERIVEEAERQADRLRESGIVEAEKRAREEAERFVTMAALDLRRETLAQKQAAIEEVLERAHQYLKSLSGDEYRSVLKRLLLRAVESGSEEIIVSASHREFITKDFIAEVNQALGPDRGHLVLSEETRGFTGGFVLRNGRKEINFTFEAMIKDARDALEADIARILFPE